MGRALKAGESFETMSEQGKVADGIFAALEALKTIARAADLPEISAKLEDILSASLEAHIEKLRSRLEAMQPPK